MARGRRLAPLAIPFVLAVVLFAPATVGGRVLSASDILLFDPPFPPPAPGFKAANQLQYDSAAVFESDGLQVREALREGRLPVWTPDISAGRPLLATQQSAPLFPLTWIGVVLPYWESLAWIAVLKLTLAAVGTVLLARALGLRLAAALVAGIAFGFGTYLVDWMMHPHSNAYVFLPWLFLFGERLCRNGRLSDAAVLAGVLGVAGLGGQPESTLLVGLATFAWVVHRLLAYRPTRPEAGRRAALGMLAAVLGLALGAVMTLPLLEALREAGEVSRSQPPLPVESGASLFFPELWGRPDRAQLPTFGPGNFTERTFYLGALPTLLAIAGLVARRPRGPQLFFAGLAVTGLVAALDTGPVYDLIAGLPLLDRMNVTRALVLASFALAMLAAFGVECLVSGTSAERRRMLGAAGAVVVVPVLVVLAMHPSWLDGPRDGVTSMLGRDAPVTEDVVGLASVLRWVLFGAAAFTLLAALLRRSRRSVAPLAAAVCLVAADLLIMGWGYSPAIPKEQATPPAPPAVTAMRNLTAGGGRVAGADALDPNTGMRWGLEDARGHEVPHVKRTIELWTALGGARGPIVGVVPTDERTPKLLDVFGVRALLLDPAALQGSELVGAPPLRDDPVVYAGPGGVVLEHPSAFPPAFVAYDWRASPDLTASLLHVGLGTVRQARDEPAIETDDRPPNGQSPPATPARVVSRTDTSVTVEVRARARGQLVLLDTFYPGWRAEVDGRSTPIRPANAAFRAVAVPPGRHEVRFSYRPGSVIAGGAISLAAGAAILACLVVPRARARRRGGKRSDSRSA
jgi:hypothetical protein